jgi:hypothetical protein
MENQMNSNQNDLLKIALLNALQGTYDKTFSEIFKKTYTIAFREACKKS